MQQCTWEFIHTFYMSFVDLEKANDHVTQGSLWVMLGEYGVLSPLIQVFIPYTIGVRAVSAVSAVSQTCSRGSVQFETLELLLYSLQIM